MSTILVNNIKDTGNNTLLTSDGSGNVTLGSGFPVSENTPAFEAYNTVGGSLSDSVATKVAFDTEVLDTDGCFDNSTNYRFTPTTAGKYFVYLCICMYGGNVDSIVEPNPAIWKNGSQYKALRWGFDNNYIRIATPTLTSIVDMNGTTDYIEGYAKLDITSGTGSILGGSNLHTFFGAYKLIGA